MPFQKGQSGNPAGRRKGSQNKASAEWKAFCEGIVTNKAYQAKVRQRLNNGELPPNLEKDIWNTGAPQPKDDTSGSRVTVNIGFLMSSDPAIDVTTDVRPEVMPHQPQAALDSGE